MIDREELKNKYLELKSIRSLASFYKKTPATIKYWLKKYNINIINKYVFHNFTETELRHFYNELGTINKVAEHFKIGCSSMILQFKKYNISYLKKPTQILFDIDFFERDTPEAFYLAGFIAADGNICKDSNRITIGLAEKDKRFLENIKNLIKYEGNLRQTIDYGSKRKPHYKDTIGYSLRFSDEKTANDLLRFNIVPAKSLILQFPKWIIDHPFVHHFIRGYFDGDGCIRMDNGQLAWKILGTEQFLLTCRSILEKYCDVNHLKLRKDKGCWALTYNGNKQVPKICEFLYNNSTFHLQRKYNIYQNAINM